LILSGGCEQNSIGLIAEDELIERMAENNVPRPDQLQILGAEGDEISSDSLKVLILGGKYFHDFYVNRNDDIVQVRVREKTTKDDGFYAKVRQRHTELKEAKVLRTIDVDCNDKANILQGFFDRDQAVRKDKTKIDPNADHENLEIVVSLLDNCGMPTLQEVDENQMAGIWAVLQHCPATYQRKYIPMLEESAQNGDLKWSVIALMKDRSLMHEGKFQIYGSQISNGELHMLYEPEFVNQRRSEIGMESLEEYLQRFDIEFNIEQKQKDMLHNEHAVHLVD